MFLSLSAVLATVLHLCARNCDLGLRGAVCASNEAGKSAKELCPQTKALVPSKHKELWEMVGASYDSPEFKDKAVEWLGGAVKIP